VVGAPEPLSPENAPGTPQALDLTPVTIASLVQRIIGHMRWNGRDVLCWGKWCCTFVAKTAVIWIHRVAFRTFNTHFRLLCGKRISIHKKRVNWGCSRLAVLLLMNCPRNRRKSTAQILLEQLLKSWINTE